MKRPVRPSHPTSAPVKASPSVDQVILALSHKHRWRILDELLKGDPLPVGELSRRLGVEATNLGKHLVVLHRTGLVERGFGQLYRLPAKFLVPGQRALDFGPVLLRLDHLD